MRFNQQHQHHLRRPQYPIRVRIITMIIMGGMIALLVGCGGMSLVSHAPVVAQQQTLPATPVPIATLSTPQPTPTVALAPNLINVLPTLPVSPTPTPLRKPTSPTSLSPTPTNTSTTASITSTALPIPAPTRSSPTISPTSATLTLPLATSTAWGTTAITQTTSAVSDSFLPGSDAPVLQHAPIPTPNILPSSYGRLLPSHGGWAERQDLPKFMTLPFSPDPYMVVLQGWFYDSGGLQSGIDYFRQDAAGNFTGFPVLAAADGYACGEWDPTDTFAATSGGCVAGYGHRVLIRHEIGEEIYYTYYGHLETIAPDLPLGSRATTVFVKRGQFLGYAGNTGTSGSAIHLHFGIFNINLGWFDPYDLRTTHEHYPDPNLRYNLRSGINDFWTTNPPSYSDEYHYDSHSLLRPGLESFWTPDFPTARQQEVQVWQPSHGELLTPPHNTIVTDTVVIQGWAIPTDADLPIEAIEIWIDDELYTMLDYANGNNSTTDVQADGNFAWEWDTTQMPNGVHTIQAIVRVAQDDDARGDTSHQADHAVLAPQSAPDKKQLVVNVQNIQGEIEYPTQGALLKGSVVIQGWAKAGGSTIEQVEVWVDGTKHGVASYGEPRYASGGDYGFSWVWDTSYLSNGTHTVQIQAVAASGAAGLLPRKDSPLHEVVVQIEHVRELPVGKWTAR